jgi:class 3 adenylate cyclase
MPPTVSVSVVFTDLVGSTELSSRLGPDESEQLRQVHFGVLRAAAAQAGGKEVKNLGDGLMVVFPSVGAALSGAVAMQQALERRNRRSSEPLSVRIGVSTGDAVEEDGDYFGETVVQAARLCAAAQGGEILATDVVGMLARSSDHRFEPVGGLELKGLPEPVPAVRVCWSLDAVAAEVPVPERLTALAHDAPTFVGRAEHLQQLREALDASIAGEQRTVLVVGEPGVGKSALLAEFACEAHRSGTVVLYGRCDEELAVPYQPWVETIGQLVVHAPQRLLRTHVEHHGLHLARLVPELLDRVDGELPPTTDAEIERYLMFQSVCSLLDAAAADAPLLVVVDDLHWSDAPTLALLRHVASTPKATPPLLVGTYRDTDVDRGHPLVDTVATLARLPGTQRLVLGGLHEGELARLVEARAGHELDPEGRAFAAALRQETNGNPFFAREILRNLAETAAVVEGEGGEWRAPSGIDPEQLPDSVLDVVRQRVDRLGADVHRTLSAASIIGRDFDLALLSRVVDEPEDVVLERLERAVTASVVAEVGGVDDRFTFAHALAQHTMHSELSAARRRRLHRRVAEAIEELSPGGGARVAELARHWIEAVAPVDVERALRAVCRAGDHALAALAPDEALGWYRQGLELLDDSLDRDPLQRPRLLVSLGTAQKQAGDPGYRETLLEAASEARRFGDTRVLVEAALTNNRGYHSNSGETDEEKVEVLYAALEAVGEEDSVERALLLATLCAESNFRLTRAELEQLFEDALAMARRSGDDRTISEVISRTRVAVYFLETVRERTSLLVESRRLADSVGDPVVCFHAAHALLWSGAGRADMAVFDEQLDTMHAISSRTGQPILRWMTRYTDAMRAAIAGDTQRSEELANEAYRIALDSGQKDADIFYGGQILRVTLMRGQLADVVEIVATAAAENPRFPVFRAVHAAARVQAGELDLGRRLLDDDLAQGFDGPHEMQWPTAMTLWTDAAVRLHHVEAAAALYPLLVPFESLTGFTGLTYDGPLGHYAGMLALVLSELEAAERHFAAALALEQGSGDRYSESLTRLGIAELHLECADAARARDELALAAAIARDGGYALVERDARALGTRIDGSI